MCLLLSVWKSGRSAAEWAQCTRMVVGVALFGSARRGFLRVRAHRFLSGSFHLYRFAARTAVMFCSVEEWSSSAVLKSGRACGMGRVRGCHPQFVCTFWSDAVQDPAEPVRYTPFWVCCEWGCVLRVRGRWAFSYPGSKAFFVRICG